MPKRRARVRHLRGYRLPLLLVVTVAMLIVWPLAILFRRPL